MKLIEKMAGDAVDPFSSDFEAVPYPGEILDLMEQMYIKGFRAAREMAAQWIQERTQYNNLFVPGFVPERVRTLGEEEVE